MSSLFPMTIDETTPSNHRDEGRLCSFIGIEFSGTLPDRNESILHCVFGIRAIRTMAARERPNQSTILCEAIIDGGCVTRRNALKDCLAQQETLLQLDLELHSPNRLAWIQTGPPWDRKVVRRHSTKIHLRANAADQQVRHIRRLPAIQGRPVTGLACHTSLMPLRDNFRREGEGTAVLDLKVADAELDTEHGDYS